MQSSDTNPDKSGVFKTLIRQKQAQLLLQLSSVSIQLQDLDNVLSSLENLSSAGNGTSEPHRTIQQKQQDLLQEMSEWRNLFFDVGKK